MATSGSASLAFWPLALEDRLALIGRWSPLKFAGPAPICASVNSRGTRLALRRRSRFGADQRGACGNRLARRREARAEAGQTLPLICLFLFVLMGMCGVVIDLGNGYLQRQQVQNMADAAALAGADAVPTGGYQAAAQAAATANGKPSDQVTVTFDGTDMVTVTVTRTSPTYLLALFGKSSIPVTATATAQIETLGQVSGHIAPYAVTRSVYANGTGTILFNENSPGAYGTVDLPTASNTTGGSCSGPTNLGTPPNVKSELSDQLPTGQLALGGCLSVKSGASQPSATVVNQMQPGNDMMDSDLASVGGGEYRVKLQPWDDSSGLPPRLMYVPIVDALPGGNGNATITGFAWFYATSATGNGNKLVINGTWVSLERPPTGPTTTYVPGLAGQILTSKLTG
jgi:Flp pilus assembly protein TadG